MFPSGNVTYTTYLCLMPCTAHWGLNTGSVIWWRQWGSSWGAAITSRCPLGPLACKLYCQKYLSRLLGRPLLPPSPSLSESTRAIHLVTFNFDLILPILRYLHLIHPDVWIFHINFRQINNSWSLLLRL